MTNENKLASMDAVGELPDFGNLLLREGGYPHLESNMQEMHNASDAKSEDSQSDAWNDASILPTECKVYETQISISDNFGKFVRAYQYFDGWKFNFAAGSEDGAWTYRDTQEFLKTIKWREVQP